MKLAPKAAVVFEGRGCVHLRLPEIDMAIADFTQAIRIDPDFAVAYRNRGHAYEKQGDLTKAKSDFESAKRLGFRDGGKDWDKPQFFDPAEMVPDSY